MDGGGTVRGVLLPAVPPALPRGSPRKPRAAGAADPLVRVDAVNEFTRANCPVDIFFNSKNFHNVHNTINISY